MDVREECKRLRISSQTGTDIFLADTLNLHFKFVLALFLITEKKVLIFLLQIGRHLLQTECVSGLDKLNLVKLCYGG